MCLIAIVRGGAQHRPPEVLEDALDDRRLQDRGDDLQFAAVRAALEVGSQLRQSAAPG
jgi:hypothetical protein